jgi:hypothetical protein
MVVSTSVTRCDVMSRVTLPRPSQGLFNPTSLKSRGLNCHPYMGSSNDALSSMFSDDWCYLDTIQEDFIEPPPFSSTPDLSPNALCHSSLSNRSSRSCTLSGYDSPTGAHTDIDYDLDNIHEQNDEFTDRLHDLLLVVARERECSEPSFCHSMPVADDDSASDYIETSSPPFGYELKTGFSLSSPIRTKYLTLSPSPTLYSPSAIASPLDRVSLSPQEYKDSATSDTEIDTLVFASPSCSPPARILKRPRSHSIDEDHLRPNRKLRRMGSSFCSS